MYDSAPIPQLETVYSSASIGEEPCVKAVLKYLLFPGERGPFLLAHHPKMLSSTSTFGLSSQPLFIKQILGPPI